MRDLASNIGVVPALAPAVQSAAANGLTVDRKGFEKVTFIVNTGAIAGDGDFSFKVQDSDDGTNWTDAPAKYLIGEAPAELEADSAYKIGYWGHKRYQRLALTKAGGTSIAGGAVAILSGANARPVA